MLTKPISAVVAIPSLNEEERISNVVTACRKQGVDVWVIDDGSEDTTAKKAEAAGAKILRHATNLGKGMAIRTALQAFIDSHYDLLLFMDADGQHDPAFIPVFLDSVSKSQADLVLGNRMSASENMPVVRRLTNQFTSWVVSLLSRQDVPDSQCGYRLVSRNFAKQFRPTTYRYDLESEMLIQAGRLGLIIQSVPVSTIYGDQKSHIHPFYDTLRFFRLVVRYRSFGI
jgi:glycosyltransferase involved in cell wall biosynthesis